jgi:hypothetical protein
MTNVLVKNVLLAGLLLVVSLVSAQNVSFNDANFKAALLDHDPIIDTNDDGEIQVTEAEAFTGTLSINEKSIADLTGLEAFVHLTRLIAHTNSFTSIDLNALSDLNYINLSVNDLTSINLSGNSKLDTLLIINNNLSSLDVSGNLKLEVLNAFGNPLPTIDVTSLVNLRLLNVGSPSTTSLDLSGNPALEYLILNGYTGTSIDISLIDQLTYLACTNTEITSLDLSILPALENLLLTDNASLSSLDISNGNTDNFEIFLLTGSPLLNCVTTDAPGYAVSNFQTGIYPFNVDSDISFELDCNNPAVYIPDDVLLSTILTNYPGVDTNMDGMISTIEAAGFNGAMDLSSAGIRNATGLEAFTGLTSLDISGNDMLNLDVSQNANLIQLDAANSGLRILSVNNGGNSSFTSFDATGNPDLTCITVDDVTYATNNWSNIPVGTGFSTDCNVVFTDTNFKNALTSYGDFTIDTNTDGEIQVSEAKVVTELNSLYDLEIDDLTGIEAFIVLEEIRVGDPSIFNGVTTPDFSQNVYLRVLDLDDNRISTLDLSLLKNLRELSCQSMTQLTTLDVSHNINLNTLNIRETHIEEIDLTQNVYLVSLNARRFSPGAPAFTTLDLSNNANLVTVELTNNLLIELILPSSGDIGFLALAENDLTTLDISMFPDLYYLNVLNNQLTELNIKNGNNSNFTLFEARGNSELTCISVDDVAYAEANFTNIEAGSGFDLDCNDPILEFPDANFLAALLNNSPAIDINADGDIRLSEAENFAGVLQLSGQNITDATGLEHFISITGIDISNNTIDQLNVKNGNNENFTVFDARGNTGLSCIQVDHVAYSEANWSNIDEGMNFSAYCESDAIVNIPDPLLKTLLLGNVDGQIIDANDDDQITYGEALTFMGNLSTSSYNITDMTGIEAFENMQGLEIRFAASISELDISALTELRTLSFTQETDENVSEIDISNNLLLETISIFGVPLGILDLSSHVNLTSFTCNSCSLTSIDVTENVLLTILNLPNNDLSEIDLQSNTALTFLALSGNPLNAIDLTVLTELEDLQITGDFTSIDLSAQTKLRYLNMQDLKTPVVDLTNNEELYEVNITGSDDEGNVVSSAVEEVIFGENTLIESLNLWGNQLTSLDLSFMIFPGRTVDLSDNQLEELNIGLVYSLDVTNNPNLTCAKTTDVAYAEANYQFDEGLTFDPNCFKTGTDILTFSVDAQLESTIDEVNHTVTSIVEAGTDYSNLNPSITISQAATISPLPAVSQDFTSTVTYTVTAENGDVQDWMVDVVENGVDPTDISLSSTSIDENSDPGSLVGEFSTTDANFIDSFDYDLVSGEGDDNNSTFQLSGNQLLTESLLDFETQNSFSIRVRTTDSNGGLFEKAFVITLNDVNETPTDIVLDNLTIDESNPIGTTVGVLSTEDADESDTFVYMLKEGNTDNASFDIEGDDLVSAEVLDFETKTSYNLEIIVTDQGGLMFEKAFVVNVNDLPAQITSIELSANAIDENELIGSQVGVFSTFGEDLSGNDTYTLTSGAGDDDNASFSISGNQLLTAESFNFEAKSSYSILVMADDGNETGTQVFSISVNDVSEAPTDLTLSNNTLTENNSIGDAIGVFTSTDEDAVNSFSYELVSGAGDADNASFSIVGDELQAAVVFDFETQAVFSIRTATHDGNGGTFEKVFSITIGDENESIVVTSPFEDLSLDEGFGTLDVDLNTVFTDQDGDELTYEVSGTNTEVVTVSLSGSTLTINEAGAFGSATITVTADDGSGVTTSDEFVVTVVDVNEVPAVVNALGDFSEEVGFGSFQISYAEVFSDGDGDVLSISVSSDEPGVVTATLIEGEFIEITEVGIGTSIITLTADDERGGVVSDTFTFTTEIPNSAPVVANAIADNTQEEGFGSFQISYAGVFTDADGDELTVSVQSSETSVVTVAVVAGEILEFTEVGIGTSMITVTANDGNGGSVSDTFIFTVSAAPNNAPVVTNPLDDVSEAEGFMTKQISLADLFSDADGDALTIEASSDEESVVTVDVISGNTLEVAEIGIGTSTITVTADDGNGGSVSDTFTFSVMAAPLALEDQIHLSVYPNPTTDVLYITSDRELDIQLSDLNGRTLRRDHGKEVRMNLETIPEGIYLIIMEQDGRSIRKRIVKAN